MSASVVNVCTFLSLLALSMATMGATVTNTLHFFFFPILAIAQLCYSYVFFNPVKKEVEIMVLLSTMKSPLLSFIQE